MIALRPVALADAEALAALRAASRDRILRWEEDGEETFTADGLRDRIAADLGRAEAGTGRAYVITDDGRPVGQLLLNSIIRGPYFRQASVGYWVAAADTGRGVATAAVALAKPIAFDDLGLRLLRADVHPGNHASAKVLARNGFDDLGPTPLYHPPTDAWHDRLLFQALNPRPE